MKKPNPAGRRATSNRTAMTVDEYFSRVPEPALSVLTKLRGAIRSVPPGEATETVSYQMPAFKRNGGVMLTGFTTSKGTVQFPLDKPLPIALIKRIVKARMAEQNAKARR